MKIKWILDDEFKDEIFDGECLLGNIFIKKENFSFLEESTYLEDFFNSLIRGFKFLDLNKNKDNIDIDIKCEPNPLSFSYISNKVFNLKYNNITLYNIFIDEFLLALYISSNRLINMLKNRIPKNKNNIYIEEIVAFLKDYGKKYKKILPMYRINEEQNNIVYSVEVILYDI